MWRLVDKAVALPSGNDSPRFYLGAVIAFFSSKITEISLLVRKGKLLNEIKTAWDFSFVKSRMERQTFFHDDASRKVSPDTF